MAKKKETSKKKVKKNIKAFPKISKAILKDAEQLIAVSDDPALLSHVSKQKQPVIGVFSTSEQQIDHFRSEQCKRVVGMVAGKLHKNVWLSDGTPVHVVFSKTVVDGPANADKVAHQFAGAEVSVLVGLEDRVGKSQLPTISLRQHFQDAPICLTCGDNGPDPAGISDKTAGNLIDWCFAAVTAVALRGRRVVLIGNDPSGMEGNMVHVDPIKHAFGIDISHVGTKDVADQLQAHHFDSLELRKLRTWFKRMVGKRITVGSDANEARFLKELAMYLIVRNLLNDQNAIGGSFYSQPVRTADFISAPLPVHHAMESLFNSPFDHSGKKTVMPFSGMGDLQHLMMGIIMTSLSGGGYPFFSDFQKAWASEEMRELSTKHRISEYNTDEAWGIADYVARGCVDMTHHGGVALPWALPGVSMTQAMKRVSMPLVADPRFPNGGNTISFRTPPGIDGIFANLSYCNEIGLSIVWDIVHTILPPWGLAYEMYKFSNPWPRALATHALIVTEHAQTAEYRAIGPRKIVLMQNLPPNRLRHFMDITDVQSSTPWEDAPSSLSDHYLSQGSALSERIRRIG